ncbi:26S proteasome regulatory complex, subunit RPN9 [Guillardia theta CCMP2712]|uniref:26S proteasome regulatory complex, subunit RPN9 n=1 Tax=Guillardia theta (strain CCMP2712) TaxID=905079 RepID=L1I6P6_GUITC|nr:26S proteasome regulatory complex, subunit RPN9 [Guillardia theta CCMP2712]EKX31540.1 26S proteasome regulatory complex, subunit RPN9 [Guillardia theta CCMP2712]|eukprot:XP_005818520.1 26S proteasome regulatory complex, subunit RPN9 [Guillardia theta CCMP2712]
MATPIPALETQKACHSHLAAMYDKIQSSASNKLWHQATLALEELCRDPCFSEEGNKDLITLYNEVVADQPSSAPWTGFASKMNPVKHASLCIRVSLQYGDSEEGIKSAIAYLEQVGTSLESDKEAYLLVRLEISRRFLQSGKIDTAKSKLEECKDVLVDFAEVDANVNSSFYLVSSLLHKTLGDAGEFYKSSLLYLAYTPLESLSEEKRQALAFDLGLAAICAEKIYQFGELLLHPILQSLKGTAGEWMVDLLHTFNKGDIAEFERVSTENAAAIQQQPALIGNAQRLREKIRIFALLELLRDIPADSRTVSFAPIAERTKLPEDEVELLVMKSLSLGIVKGTISGVENTFLVTWVQPRVVDKEAIKKHLVKLSDWMEKVQRTSEFLATETPEIVA